MIEALDCPGFLVKTPDELTVAIGECLHTKDRPSLINVVIDPMAVRKQQDFDWLTRSKMWLGVFLN